MKVAIVGIQGVPANYGGFESLVENLLGDNCPKGIEYTVFCSSKDMSKKISCYKGARLKYVPLKANGIQSIPYDIISLCRCLHGYDVTLVLGVSGCLFIPIFRFFNRKKLIINIDGLEHRREKWGKLARWILKKSESMAVQFADTIISDNKGIQDYVTETYGKSSALIAYGGDHAKRNLTDSFITETLDRYHLSTGNYAITVCRIEPENNSHVILEAFSKTDRNLVFIGNWRHSAYATNLREGYSNVRNIHLLDPIYDLDILYALRANAGIYIHGHSAGGTNPSLVEAMFFGIPIIAYDVVYNRETTENQAYYFSNADGIIDILSQKNLNGLPMMEIAKRRYTWQVVANQYCNLYNPNSQI